MPIETICKGCARKLRVADEHAGRKARCPHCKAVYEVPDVLAHHSPRQTAETMWRMKTSEGAVYGPASRTELDEWRREGRIAADSQLQQLGATDWINATAVYPDLGAAGAVAPNPSPFASGSLPQTNPAGSHAYRSPAQSHGYYVQPHRGGLILTFGIISWVGCTLFFVPFNLGFAIAAWLMGRADLAAMQAGRMDTSGQSATQAGMILGMLNAIASAAVILLAVAFFLIAIIAG